MRRGGGRYAEAGALNRAGVGHPQPSLRARCSPWRRIPSALTPCSPGCIQLMPAVDRLPCGSSSGLAGGFPCKRRTRRRGRTCGNGGGLAGGFPCKRRRRRWRGRGSDPITRAATQVLFCPPLTRDPGRRWRGLCRRRLRVSPTGLLIAAQLLPLPLSVRAGQYHGSAAAAAAAAAAGTLMQPFNVSSS